MKILHLTKTLAGGAGIAAARTVAAQLKAGVDAMLWTAGSVPGLGPLNGSLRRWLMDKADSIPTRLHWRRRSFAAWSNNWMATRIAEAINLTRPDIVHLHWIGQGFVELKELNEMRSPIVWTLHDAWAFTGGCHYPDNCIRYREACGCCPQLASERIFDLSRSNLAKKKEASIHIAHWITPSEWLSRCAKDSGVCDPSILSVIPNTLDEDEWAPIDQAEARRALAIPSAALVFVAGAMDLRETRKGNQLLPEAISLVSQRVDRPVTLLLFGKGGANRHAGHMEIRSLGALSNPHSIIQAFSAADTVLVPSLQDNFPNIVMEAQACGCPVVGFHSGGIQEMIHDGYTGLLTRTMTAEGLAAAVLRWLESMPCRGNIISLCRERHRAHFAPSTHVKALQCVYDTVLGVHRSHGK